MTDATINRLIFNLQKPARYTGCELNQIKKEDPFIRMAISYPDLYEVGMSNNGIRILYDIANRISDVSCERVFAVPDDFENKTRAMKIPLYTLETNTPLCDLDLLGFNAAYELLYTNILQILDLGQIPVFRKDRNDEHPIVIAGGESISNPLPISDFIDAFFIGDGEEGIVDILNAIRTSKLESLNRQETLELLGNIDGVYIAPQVFKNRASINLTPKAVKKRITKGESIYNPPDPIMPNLKIAQERLVIELTRGCKNLCNFCHSGYYELPYRRMKPVTVNGQIQRLLKNAHYSDLTLSSLSISDYKYLIELLNMVLPALIEKGISISLPSLRVDKRTLPVIEQISDLRKASLTFAVESACDEIRNIANKKLNTGDILSIAEHVFGKGWKLLKLYFMIGLPGCDKYDEAGTIIELLRKIHFTGGKKRDLNVTISPFVPKPHTPFQRERQMDTEYFSETILKIKRGLPRQVSIKAHDVNASMLEGVMARGDLKLNQAIYDSYMDGARLDSWREHFKFEIWKKNLDKIGGWQNYFRARNKDEVLPWSFISTGFEKLINADRKVPDIIRKEIQKPPFRELDTPAISEAFNRFKRKYEVKKRIRIKLSKQGKARYISHLDFIGIIIRALRITDLPVSFTQGFNKRERISMGFPLPVGIESVYELCDVDLFEDTDISTIASKLSRKLPEGIIATDAVSLTLKESIMSITSAALYNIETDDIDLYEKIIKNLQLEISFAKETGKGSKIIKFKDAVIDYNILNENAVTEKKQIVIKTALGDENSVRIDIIVLALAGARYDEFYKFRITRLCQYRKDNGELKEIF